MSVDGASVECPPSVLEGTLIVQAPASKRSILAKFASDPLS